MPTLLLKKISFYFILFALPFIILMLIEVILRVSGFGESIPLFIDKANTANNQTSTLLQPNPKVVNRYFANEKLAPNVSPDTVYFNKDKQKNSYRIIIQGGSTAAGFPYGRWGSLQGMLEQRFKRLYPNKEIEIINTAMAAVNTYTLLDFVDEIIEQQPDLVLIYTGHNEYLGVMGVGSEFAAKGGRFATLMHLTFKNLRLYQLLQSFYYQFLLPENVLDKENTQHDRSLMSKVAKETEIALDSELYQQGLNQFEQNLSAILRKYQQSNVPVIMGNLVSNESGQIPFSVINTVDWPAYNEKINSENSAENIEKLEQQLQKSQESLSAEIYYKLGLNYQKQAQYAKAKEAFILAKDYDLLRFRAPSEFNEIIKRLANVYNAHFVDTQAYFSHNSPQGIIGNTLILEHLHPTLEGYFLLAEAFNEKIIAEKFIGVPVSSYPKHKAYLDIPVSHIDKLYGELKVTQLMQDYPFTPAADIKKQKLAPVLLTNNDFEKSALIKRINKNDWLTLQKELLVGYQQQKNSKEAAKVASLIATAMKDNHRAHYIAGQLYQQQKDWSLASYYHKQATRLLPTNYSYYLALAQDYYFQAMLNESLVALEQALAIANKDKSASSDERRKIISYINTVKKAQSAIQKNANKAQ